MTTLLHHLFITHTNSTPPTCSRQLSALWPWQQGSGFPGDEGHSPLLACPDILIASHMTRLLCRQLKNKNCTGQYVTMNHTIVMMTRIQCHND